MACHELKNVTFDVGVNYMCDVLVIKLFSFRQVGQQDFVLGLKFNTKVMMEYYQRDVEVFDSGKRRDVDFKMVEGDFQVYEGKWSVEQVSMWLISLPLIQIRFCDQYDFFISRSGTCDLYVLRIVLND